MILFVPCKKAVDGRAEHGAYYIPPPPALLSPPPALLSSANTAAPPSSQRGRHIAIIITLPASHRFVRRDNLNHNSSAGITQAITFQMGNGYSRAVGGDSKRHEMYDFSCPILPI